MVQNPVPQPSHRNPSNTFTSQQETERRGIEMSKMDENFLLEYLLNNSRRITKKPAIASTRPEMPLKGCEEQKYSTGNYYRGTEEMV